MKNIKIICLLYLLLLMGGTISFKLRAQEENLEIKNLRSGKLDNGLSYFIKDVDEPQEKTWLRLYVKVGGLQQDSDQLEIAHLLEHVAFKPTDSFPKGIFHEILPLGMTARDISASTGKKSTRYSFAAPVQNKKAIKMGLNWLKSIAMDLRLTDEDINLERGSVKQEFIFGTQNGRNYFYAEKKLEAQLFPCYLTFNDFLNHIETFPNENLRRFYKDWYRPGLMGVTIVGNIENMVATKQLVESVFSKIPKQYNARKKRNCDSLYFARPSQFAIVELKENTGTKEKQKVEFRLFFRLPKLAKTIGTTQGYKHYVAFKMLLNILSERLYQKHKTTNPSFRVIVINAYKYRAKPFSFAWRFKSKETSSKQAFQYAFKILKQLQKYGVLEEEWRRVKENYLSNKTNRNVNYWQNQLNKYFVHGHALFAEKQKIIHNWVKALSVEEFNALTKQFLSSMPEDIGIIAPSGSKALQYTDHQVRSWVKEANRKRVKPYQLPKMTSELMSSKESNNLKKVGFTDHGWQSNGGRKLILENGIKVILKPFQPTKGVLHRQIKLHGFVEIGASCFPKTDYYSAINAPHIVQHAGLGEYSAGQIRSFRKKYDITRCTPYIDYNESGIHGTVYPTNVEELLQLIYLYFAKPTFGMQPFEAWKKTQQKLYERQKSASRDFKNKIRHFYGDSVLYPSLGLESAEAYNSIAKTNGKRSFEIYRRIFGQPQGFTFIITGNFEMEQMLPLVQKYLGNIPRSFRKWACEINEKTCTPIMSGPIYKEIVTKIHHMESVKYNLRFIQVNCRNNPWKETVKIRVLGKLTGVMLKRLRYKKGFALYNFGASGNYDHNLAWHTIKFDITCQEKELKAIQQECQKIIQEIKNGNIKESDFQQALKRIGQRYDKQTLLRHRNMQELLYEQLRYDEPWVELGKYKAYLQSLNIQNIVKVANEYFKDKHRYEFVMREEKLCETEILKEHILFHTSSGI